MKVLVYTIHLYVMATHIVLMVKMKLIVSISVLINHTIAHLTVITEIFALAHQGIFSVCQEVVFLYRKLCDKKEHCTDALDEHLHVYIGDLNNSSSHSLTLDINKYINTLMQQHMTIQHGCSQSSGSLFHVKNVQYKMYSKQQAFSPSSLSPDVKFPCGIYSIPYTSHDQFSLDRLCVYDHDCDDKYTYHCFNGFHLLKCKHMYCVGRFKCPSSYCISLAHICNKVCDCPNCEDEKICSKLLCPSMVLMEQLGSGLTCSEKVESLRYSMN